MRSNFGSDTVTTYIVESLLISFRLMFCSSHFKLGHKFRLSASSEPGILEDDRATVDALVTLLSINDGSRLSVRHLGNAIRTRCILEDTPGYTSRTTLSSVDTTLIIGRTALLTFKVRVEIRRRVSAWSIPRDLYFCIALVGRGRHVDMRWAFRHGTQVIMARG